MLVPVAVLEGAENQRVGKNSSRRQAELGFSNMGPIGPDRVLGAKNSRPGPSDEDEFPARSAVALTLVTKRCASTAPMRSLLPRRGSPCRC